MSANQEDNDLYFPLMRRFRTPLLSGKKKSKWEKYIEMYHMLSNFKGCTSVLISVRGLITQTTINNKITAEYINFYFWGMTSKARTDLRDMNQEDDLICIRLSTNFYETTVTVGGTFEESDFMIFVTQNTPNSIKRPIYNFRRLLVQGAADCDFPVETADPVPAMRKAIVEMAERVQDTGFSPYERKKIAFLSAAERSSMISDKLSTMSLSVEPSKRTLTMSIAAGKDDNASFAARTGASSCSASIASYASEGGTRSGTKWSTAESKSGSRQITVAKEKKFHLLRKEKYDWIKIDRDDPMVPPEVAPLYSRTTSGESSEEEDDDIGYWRKLPEKTFSIFGADGTVIQDEVTIGFKPCSGEQIPPRKWTSKKAKKEMVFKRRMTIPSEQQLLEKKAEEPHSD